MGGEYRRYSGREEFLESVETDHILRPLYMYEHGGVALSTGAYSDPWDSGQVGYVRVTPESAEKIGIDISDTERVNALIDQEVAALAAYINGDIYSISAHRIALRRRASNAPAHLWAYPRRRRQHPRRHRRRDARQSAHRRGRRHNGGRRYRRRVERSVSATPKAAPPTAEQPEDRARILDKLPATEREFLSDLLSDISEELAHASGALDPCRECGEDIDCSTCQRCSDTRPMNYDAEFQRSDCAHLRAIESVMKRMGSIR